MCGIPARITSSLACRRVLRCCGAPLPQRVVLAPVQHRGKPDDSDAQGVAAAPPPDDGGRGVPAAGAAPAAACCFTCSKPEFKLAAGLSLSPGLRLPVARVRVCAHARVPS